MKSLYPSEVSWLLHDHKDVLAASHGPIPSLAMPIAVAVRVPVNVIPVMVGMHCRSSSGMHRRPARPVHHLSGICFLRRRNRRSQ
jgi:hypothetical protein